MAQNVRVVHILGRCWPLAVKWLPRVAFPQTWLLLLQSHCASVEHSLQTCYGALCLFLFCAGFVNFISDLFLDGLRRLDLPIASSSSVKVLALPKHIAEAVFQQNHNGL